MEEQFFEDPILNSPYEYPKRYWELDAQGQPTQRVIESRRKAEFITPIPKPRKRREGQRGFVFDEGLLWTVAVKGGLATAVVAALVSVSALPASSVKETA